MAEDWDAFAKRASETIMGLLRDAADFGYEHGKQAAAIELRQKVARALELGAVALAPLSSFPEMNGPVPGSIEEQIAQRILTERAAPGSVKPTLARFVSDHPGLTVDQIQERTGIKRNSVRGTLWTLSNEKIVERRGHGWFPVAQTNEAADGQSAAPISQPIGPFAEDRQADPLEPGREVAHHNMLE